MKTGDKLVCIDNTYRSVENDVPYYSTTKIKKLTIGKLYTILKFQYVVGKQGIIINNDVEEFIWVNLEDFVTLKEYRKLKLKKINEKT